MRVGKLKLHVGDKVSEYCNLWHYFYSTISNKTKND